MDARLEDIFFCRSCEYRYLRDDEGPSGECKRCFWSVPINRKAILTMTQVVVMMAREMEERHCRRAHDGTFKVCVAYGAVAIAYL